MKSCRVLYMNNFSKEKSSREILNSFAIYIRGECKVLCRDFIYFNVAIFLMGLKIAQEIIFICVRMYSRLEVQFLVISSLVPYSN